MSAARRLFARILVAFREAVTPVDPREAYLREAVDEEDFQNRFAEIEKGRLPARRRFPHVAAGV